MSYLPYEEPIRNRFDISDHILKKVNIEEI